MKKHYLLFFVFGAINTISSQTINFSDLNFKSKLLEADVTNEIAKDLAGNYFKIDANLDGQIQVIEVLNVAYLDISNSSINTIDEINNFYNLNELRCYLNNLATLNVSNLINLEILNCSGNLLTSLNLNGLINLQKCYFSLNSISSIDFMGLTNLKEIYCTNNQLITLDLTLLPNLMKLNCQNNLLTTINVSGLNNLVEINCSHNQFTTLFLSNLVTLEKVNCSNNLLTSLNLSGSNNLNELNCSFNTIPQANILGLNNTLLSLFYSNNQLTTLDLSNLVNLKFLNCGINLLNSLDLTNTPNLISLRCNNNLLTSLDVSNLVNLGSIDCSFNQIQVLDFSNSSLLWLMNINDNDLVTLLIKNGKIQSPTASNLFNNPNLNYVCIDSNDLFMGNYVTSLYPNCTVNTYCSFTPGGTFYTIQGNNQFDGNNNGCDTLDISIPNLKFNITNSSISGNYISNTTGNYSIPLLAGTNTITPQLENPTYFSISPTSTTINFPIDASPFIQNFCITPNGVHHDLEIVIIPINNARPGFDALYRIKFKNKGNQIENATININFNDLALDFVSATIIPNTQSIGLVTWDIGTLAPLQIGEINIIFNVNSPFETPPVNINDILSYTATINGLNSDATINDNTFTLNQTIVNSFDPNDKKCLEGEMITPERVGDYVHYRIRFENNGTANAQNIVLKDIIDSTKFDISSLVTVDGSHSFITRTSNSNQVEFIFENINLPFDESINKGFVVFKIKTKPTLVIGNTFSNSASIYFDYNFPINTNTATTIIQALANPDFEFENYFVIAPNPVSDILTIQNKSEGEIKSLSIYNVLGQLVLIVTNPNSTFDVSNLKSGSYFIKVTSTLGSSSSRFIKK